MILIIGAGVTGLTCAACLDGDVLIVERDSEVGGYCRTTKRNGFVWDRAGHFFHFSNSKIKRFFDKSIPDDSFAVVEKSTSIFLSDVGYVDFPFQKNIHQLPKHEYIRCLIDLYEAEKGDRPYSNFKEYIYHTLGAGICDRFLIPYNEKLYACDLNELDQDAMGRFFPKANFENVLLNAKQGTNSSYNQFFSYPRDGANAFVEVLKHHALRSAEICLNTTVEYIDIASKEARLSSGDVIRFEKLVNTAPLDKFCNLAGIDTSAAQLSANKVVVFNLGFDRCNEIKAHWIYYPGDEVFYRVGCYHNIFGTTSASLYVEIGMARDDAVDEAALLDRVLNDLEKVGLIESDFILVDHEFIQMDPAYVHINKTSNAFKEQLKSELEHSGIYTAGRYGNWTYCSIEDNLIEAHGIAKIIGGASMYRDTLGLDSED
ncbi:protoporphyrinogen/coproporphyrinogen oxidase [Roseibium aestuarii]|uniref:Protoporphyrinogen/coproporphyrinogen oxidase n=1 Tax=Roseibium aestuarii TaxID=2600299 RepID=A0ABW4JZ70_9HYPH|nr:FAD-dependent oxidoreductase [Roseibium aestuarii]